MNEQERHPVVDYTPRQRKAFSSRLAAALKDKTRDEIVQASEKIDYSSGSLYNWARDEQRPPGPPVVFALERVLGLSAGELSQHLGFLPRNSDEPGSTVDSAIAAEDGLTEAQRRALLDVYRTMTDPSQ